MISRTDERQRTLVVDLLQNRISDRDFCGLFPLEPDAASATALSISWAPCENEMRTLGL